MVDSGLKGGDNPRSIQVDLTGVLKLKIEVETPDNNYETIYAALAEARFFDKVN